MNKIINYKKYDTKTARALIEKSNGFRRGDGPDIHETLYQKKTNEFFLYVEGGGLTEYAQIIDYYDIVMGEKIIPLTEEKAKKWVMDNFSADTYEKLFDEEVSE